MALATTSPSSTTPAVPSPAGSVPAVPSAAGTEAPTRRDPRSPNVLGVLLFVVADAMALAALLALYFGIKNGSSRWPPSGVSVGTYIPTVITITAVLSFFSAQWGYFSVRRNDPRNAAVGMALTVIFGLAIANLEWQAFVRAGFSVDDHAYGTLYFLLIGYHMAHVLAATVLLALVAMRALAGHFSASDYEPVRAVTIFWHYSGAVWFAVMTALFLLSRHG